MLFPRFTFIIMKARPLFFFSAIISILLTGWIFLPVDWTKEKHKNYDLFYQKVDEVNKPDYVTFIDNGIHSVKDFFSDPYKNRFDIYIHPNRRSLDSQWRKDWNMPDFRSECWMVASGVANKLDIISPKIWDTGSCEHSYANKTETQQIITHELFHVYHGQFNASPDFSNVDTLDWFVEGLATYASGQCTAQRIAEVKSLVITDKASKALINFWKGKLRYGLSGSLVMYIDSIYGRQKLKELLQYNKNSAVLASLNITEEELLKGWKKYVEK